MHQGDIKLDDYGNSVIENGSFVLTTGDREFIARMLLSAPGSWRFHEELGVALDKHIGLMNTPATHAEMEKEISKALRICGFVAHVVVISDGTPFGVSISIRYLPLDGQEYEDIDLHFELSSGKVVFDAPEPKIQKIVLPTITNKYIRRR